MLIGGVISFRKTLRSRLQWPVCKVIVASLWFGFGMRKNWIPDMPQDKKQMLFRPRRPNSNQRILSWARS